MGSRVQTLSPATPQFLQKWVIIGIFRDTMKENISRVVFGRRVFVILTLLIQIVFLIFLIAGTGAYFHYANWVLRIISIFVCVHVLNKHAKAAYKITWMFLIMLVPIFGGILYIFFNSVSSSRKNGRLIRQVVDNSRNAFYLFGNHLPELINACPEFKPQA